MAIAQMNWGRLKAPLSDPGMAEFDSSLANIYHLAEEHEGFIWRIPDEVAAQELRDLGHDERFSATVSVWHSVRALKDYTFQSLLGDFVERAREWFDIVEGPQLVIWDVEMNARPTFTEAFRHLETLKRLGPTPLAYGWPE